MQFLVQISSNDKVNFFVLISLCFCCCSGNKHLYRAKPGEINFEVEGVNTTCVSDSLVIQLKLSNNSKTGVAVNFSNAVHFISLVDSDSLGVTAHPASGHYDYSVPPKFYYVAPAQTLSMPLNLKQFYFYNLKPNQTYSAQLSFYPVVSNTDSLPKGFKNLRGKFRSNRFVFTTCEQVRNAFRRE